MVPRCFQWVRSPIVRLRCTGAGARLKRGRETPSTSSPPECCSLLVSSCFLSLTACLGTPSISGVRGTPPAPDEPWIPPARNVLPEARRAAAADAGESAEGGEGAVQELTLAEAIDRALQNNPRTRLSWANARAAAAAYGSRRGGYLPTLDGGSPSRGSRPADAGPGGGRADSTDRASFSRTWSSLRWTSGASKPRVSRLARTGRTTRRSRVVLDTALAYFDYLPARAPRGAGATLRDARTNPKRPTSAARRDRHDRGRASGAHGPLEAVLTRDSARGQLQTARGALALGWGFVPMHVRHSAPPRACRCPVADSVGFDRASVESRPDLAAARAEAARTRAECSVRSERIPSLMLDGTGSVPTSRRARRHHELQRATRCAHPPLRRLLRAWNERRRSPAEVAAARSESLERESPSRSPSYHSETATRVCERRTTSRQRGGVGGRRSRTLS